ncbi:MAG: V-type proton ATPase subunit E [Lachnoclostridium sp.]|jgi:V/A-type H+/Na+-transporting ATPase subunit E
MTGLEKITKHIKESAQTFADQTLEKANEQAKQILANARLEGEKECARIKDQSKQEVQSCLSRAESAANLQKRKLILSAKQEMIRDVFNHAKENLTGKPDKEYFDILLKMIKKYALNKPGKIILSETDKKRLPAGFSEMLNTCLAEKTGAMLTVADETANIDGGFILTYGDIEINCSFDALFAEAKDVLQDKVSEILFQ